MTKSIITTQSQRGLGLVELMISITLSLMILAGVFQMYSTSSRNSAATDANSRIQETMRYALNFIKQDVNHAGNMGCFGFQVDSDTTSGALSNDGDSIISFLTNNTGRYLWDRFVSGGDGVGPNNSDSLTVRYMRPSARIKVLSHTANQFVVDASDPAYDMLQQYQVVTAADCNRSYVFMITNVPDSTGVINYAFGVTSPPDALNEGQSNSAAYMDVKFKDINEYTNGIGTPMYLFAGSDSGSFTYYIDDALEATTACSATNPESCALFREAQGVARELVTGVSDLQVNYGQEVASVFTMNTAGSVSWSDIDRLQVTLKFSSPDQVQTNVGAKVLEKDLTQTITLANQTQ